MDIAQFFGNVVRGAPCSLQSGRTTLYKASMDAIAQRLGSYIQQRYGPRATGTQIESAYRELIEEFRNRPSLMRSALRRDVLAGPVLNDFMRGCQIQLTRWPRD